MTDFQIKLYYEALNLIALVHSMNEIPASELDIKHLMETNVYRIQMLLNQIKDGE